MKQCAREGNIAFQSRRDILVYKQGYWNLVAGFFTKFHRISSNRDICVIGETLCVEFYLIYPHTCTLTCVEYSVYTRTVTKYILHYNVAAMLLKSHRRCNLPMTSQQHSESAKPSNNPASRCNLASRNLAAMLLQPCVLACVLAAT